mgnify:CR=1 FL=1
MVNEGNPIPSVRPDWDEFFLGVAQAFSRRADCRRRQVGAVVVGPDHRVISLGYNGAPSRHPGCLAGNCPRGLLSTEEVAAYSDYSSGPGRCIAVHAEANALLYARTDCSGATCYVTAKPCPGCRILLMGAGVSRAVWLDGEEDYTILREE